MFSVLPLSLARACVWPVLCPPAAIAIDSAAIVSAAIVSLVLPAADTVTAPGALARMRAEPDVDTTASSLDEKAAWPVTAYRVHFFRMYAGTRHVLPLLCIAFRVAPLRTISSQYIKEGLLTRL